MTNLDFNKNFRILDCTLRDGSYVVDFQFTKEDNSTIVKAIESVGFDLIEVGHGLGLGASEKTEYKASESDETYLQATADAAQNADWGMFCIPGIANLNHIDMAANYGMKFIRIGTNVEDYLQSRPFIERAKKHGMFTCTNFMKSYTSSPEDFAYHALEAEKFGADLVYIVDSAGGMFPEEIEKYVHAIRDKSMTLRLGFHGHNNLGMAVANSLKALELGIEVIDTSLQGLGRSAGNTPTELFISALKRKGLCSDMDIVSILKISEQFISPFVKNHSYNSIDVISGYSLFHSSYLPIVEKYSKEYQVDLLQLIIEVCERDRVNAPIELVREQAELLSKNNKFSTHIRMQDLKDEVCLL